ncbi:alpha/beta hydrolase [Lentzea sp.]|uniref:alpha/beta hydrolase n=1 Tax=Lentzea sp. TaxID=56099 RepID=UPI002ED50AA1
MTPFYEDILACLGWTGAVNNPQRPLHVPHAPPILMTNSLHDVATPYEWAQNVASQLPTATLLTVQTPAPGRHCPAEWPTGEPTDVTRSNAPTTTATHAATAGAPRESSGLGGTGRRR